MSFQSRQGTNRWEEEPSMVNGAVVNAMTHSDDNESDDNEQNINDLSNHSTVEPRIAKPGLEDPALTLSTRINHALFADLVTDVNGMVAADEILHNPKAAQEKIRSLLNVLGRSNEATLVGDSTIDQLLDEEASSGELDEGGGCVGH